MSDGSAGAAVRACDVYTKQRGVLFPSPILITSSSSPSHLPPSLLPECRSVRPGREQLPTGQPVSPVSPSHHPYVCEEWEYTGYIPIDLQRILI